jgi:hypothetical protein
MKTKNKEIIKKNILIAEFMGGEPVNKVKDNPIAYSFPFEFGHQESWDEGGFLGSGKSSCWNIEDLQYHLSWDWLMPVITKIESLGFYISITKSNITCCKDTAIKPIFSIYNYNDKHETTHLAVIEFINWYNKQTEWFNNK